MRSALIGFDRMLGVVSRLVGVVGTTGIGLLGLLVVADIAGRQMGTPVRGTVELAQMAVVAVTFLVLPYAMHREGHVRSTVILNRVPPAVRQVMDFVAYLVGLVAFALIAWASYQPAVQAWRTSAFEGEGALRVPTWPVRWVIVAVAILMVLECLNGMGRRWARKSEPLDHKTMSHG